MLRISAKVKSFSKYLLVGLWLIFVLSFAIWWLIFGVQQLEKLYALQPEMHEYMHLRRMLLWEGAAWIVLLLAGGISLTLMVIRGERRARQIRDFFAAFSHDVKTALASLKLQSESLKEDLGVQSPETLDRLIADTVRLEIQLENSLDLACTDEKRLYIEQVRLAKVLESLRYQWPQLNIQLTRDCELLADQRSLRTVLSNLIQNSYVHGQAKQITFAPELQDHRRVAIGFTDDGCGFSGDVQNLGRLFARPLSTSGSGVGLYVSRRMVEQMAGQMMFVSNHLRGFGGRIILQGRMP